MQDTFFSCLLFSLTPLHILFSFQLIQETCFLDIKEITECVCVFMCTYLCVCACVNMCVCMGNYMFICVVVIRNLGNPWDFVYQRFLFTVIGILTVVLYFFFLPRGLWNLLWSSLSCSLWFYGLDFAAIVVINLLQRVDINYEGEDVLGAREPIKVSLVRLNNARGRRTFT